ncbi:MAG: GerAB/ArcD/ProY family transporter [Peptococcaceae bacterium]
MIKRGTISPRQVFFIITMLLTGIYILILPRHMVSLTGTDGWLVLLGGGMISGVMLFFVNKISMKFPGKTVIEFAPLVMGKWLGKGIGVVLAAYYTLLAAVSLRIFTEMLKSVLLAETPRWIVITTLLGLITWIVQNGIEDIARFTELIAPIIILFLITALIGDVGHMEVIRLQPVLQSDTGSLVKGVLSALSYFGIIIALLMLYPYVNAPEKLTRTSMGALLFAVLITIAFFLGTVSTFGIYETARMAWPVIELVKMVHLGEFLERVESLFLSVWLSIAFINISVLAFCSVVGWTQLTNKKNYGKVTYPIMFMLFALSLWPKDLLVVLGIYQFNFTYGFVISLILPLFLFIVSLFHKGGSSDARR